MAFLDFMAPPAHKPALPAEKIDKEYKAMRLKVFLGDISRRLMSPLAWTWP